MPDAAYDPSWDVALGVDPTDLLRAQRAQSLAQALTAMSLQAPQVQEAAPVRGIQVQPRIGAINAISKLGEALLGNQQLSQAGQLEQKIYGQMLNPVPGTASALPSLTGDPVTDRHMALMMGRAPYMAAVAKNYEWTDPVKTSVFAHAGDVPAAQTNLQGAEIKNRMIDLRPNMSAVDPVTNRRMFGINPEGNMFYGAADDGSVQAFPITNAATLEAWKARQVKQAQESVTPITTPNQQFPGGPPLVTYPPPPPGFQAPAPVAPGGTPPAPSASAGAGVTSAPQPAAPRPPTASAQPRMPFTAGSLEGMKKGAESGEAYADKLSKNAESAIEVRRNLAELSNLARSARPSALNNAKLELGSYMVAAMGPQSAAKVSQYLGVDLDALTAAAKQTGSLALSSVHDMTTRGTNFDLATFMKYNPNLNMATPGGFARVADFIDQKMRQEVDKLEDFAQYSRTAPHERWAIDHPANWLAKQNALINQGRTNSRPPLENFDLRLRNQGAPQ